MDTMEVTKLVGAVCGSLLVFLLIQTAAHAIYNTESEAVGWVRTTYTRASTPRSASRARRKAWTCVK